MEIPQFPEKAYREAIVNSIMHRDYFDKSSEIMIEVFKNKLSVYNPGGLVRWLKPEEFGKISKTRNPIIASLLSRTIYVEKMGTGIKRIREAVQDAKLPEPEFRFDEHNFFVEIRDDGRENVPVTPQATPQATPQVSLTELELKIINLIKTDQTISRAEMAKKLSISGDTVKEYLEKLKKKGVLVRKGKTSSGHWEVRK